MNKKSNAQKGESKRLPWYGFVDPATLDAIRRLAAELGISQSEVVDKAMANLESDPFSETISYLLDLTTQQKHLLEEKDVDWLYLADQLDLLSKTLKEK